MSALGRKRLVTHQHVAALNHNVSFATISVSVTALRRPASGMQSQSLTGSRTIRPALSGAEQVRMRLQSLRPHDSSVRA